MVIRRVRGSPPSVVTSRADTPADDLVRRAQRGDVGAFEELYRAHAPAVHRLCRRMVGDERTARDLLQDVFVRAWEKLGSFRGESAFGTWLHRLGVNEILRHLKATKRDVLRFADVEEGAPVADGRSTGEEAAVRMDIDAAVAQLAPGARAVFELHDMQGYSHDEIAQLLGLAGGTVRAQLWRARRQLMRILGT